jgi:hypothetical protein
MGTTVVAGSRVLFEDVVAGSSPFMAELCATNTGHSYNRDFTAKP